MDNKSYSNKVNTSNVAEKLGKLIINEYGNCVFHANWLLSHNLRNNKKIYTNEYYE